MLCYSSKVRVSAGIVAKLEQCVQQGRPQTLEGLKELHRLPYQLKDILLRGGLSEFAEALDYAQAQEVKLSPPEVTDSLIDEMYHEAVRQGLWGASS